MFSHIQTRFATEARSARSRTGKPKNLPRMDTDGHGCPNQSPDLAPQSERALQVSFKELKKNSLLVCVFKHPGVSGCIRGLSFRLRLNGSVISVSPWLISLLVLLLLVPGIGTGSGFAAASGEDLDNAAAAAPVPDAPPPPRFEDEIVVTATRTEAEVRTLGNAITVIDRAEIAASGCRTVAEAIAAAPGVQVISNGPPGSVTGVFLRGANSEHTLVLVDGVEVNDPMSPSRSFDFGNLTAADVERIEIIRGPQSTVYGSDAIGGIVHVITRRGEGRPRLEAELEGGSYGSRAARAAVLGEGKGWRYALTVSHAASDGYSAAGERYGNTEPDGWRNYGFSGNLQHDFDEQWSFRASARMVDGRTGLDNFGGPGGDDPNFAGDFRQASGRAELGYAHPSGRWVQKLAVAWAGTERVDTNAADAAHPGESSTGLYEGSLGRLEWQHQFFPHRDHVLTAGYEYQRERGRSSYRSESLWGPYESDFPDSATGMHSLYLQDQWQAGSRFWLTSGLRLDRHDRFGNDLSVRIAPVLAFHGGDTRLRGSFGTGFKAPSLYQLYAPATPWGPVGNLELRPEQSWTVDGGLDRYLLGKRLWLSATVFYNRFTDLITFADGYENLPETASGGLELAGTWEVWEGWRLSANYTFTQTENRDTGEELLRRARHTGSIQADVRPWRALRLTGLLYGKGARWDMDYAAWPARRVRLDGYLRLDVQASYPLFDTVELFVSLRNLLDDLTDEIYGYGVPGRSAQGGVRLTF